MTVTAQPSAHQLAGLAALEALVEIAMHALVESYRELHRDSRPRDSPESITAGTLVDLCGRLLVAIDRHRRHVVARLPQDQRAWPF